MNRPRNSQNRNGISLPEKCGASTVQVRYKHRTRKILKPEQHRRSTVRIRRLILLHVLLLLENDIRTTEPRRTPEVLVEIYKAENRKLPQVLEFGPERRDKCRRRLARDPQRFIDQFTRAVIKAQETPFLYGEGDRGWKADFDWLIANDRNVIRVLEGRYDSGARAGPGNGGATVFARIRKEREESNHGSDRVA
jgi:hypothetical protein